MRRYLHLFLNVVISPRTTHCFCKRNMHNCNQSNHIPPMKISAAHSMRSFLTSGQLQGTRFVQPSPGNGLIAHCTDDSERSLAAGDMGVRELTMALGTATPTHVHYEKSKIYYVLDGAGDLIVWNDEGPQVFPLVMGDPPVAVPPRHPHALLTSGTHVRLLVVTSTANNGDIVWEPGVADLVSNTHLQ